MDSTQPFTPPSGTPRRQADRLAVLYDIARQIVGELDLPQLLRKAADLVQTRFDYYNVSLFMFDEATNELVATARASQMQDHMPVERLGREQGMVGWTYRNRKTLLANDVTGEPRFYNPRGIPTQSELCVPITFAGVVLGVLDVQSPALGAFDDEDVVALETLADQLAVAIRNARLFEETVALRHFHESIVRTMNEGVVVSDDLGVFTFVNPAAASILGYFPDELVGQHWSAIVLPDQRALVAAADRRRALLQTDRYELQLMHRNGTPVPVLVSGAPWMDPASGGYAGTLAVFTDLREQKLLEAQFQHAQKMEALGRLAGGVAHDFSNLLAVIRVSSDLLTRGLPSGTVLAEHVERIQDACYRATDLTRQLLRFGRQDPARPRLLDLNEAVTTLTKMLRRIIGESINLVVRPATDLWLVTIDRSHLDQILVNLVVNACDAMPEGGTLVIETANAPLDASYRSRRLEVPPGDYVVLTVSDTGTGMDPTIEARLFEPFFTTKPPGEGTGLGLATVFGIVKQNQGDIVVDTQAGKGTQFRVYLPRARLDAS